MGKIGPPLCYTSNFGDAGDEKVEGKRGQKNQQHGNLIVNFNNIHKLRGGGRRRIPCPPPKSYTYMGDGRATVQQDTLVSIGSRCHNTFHLHLHTGREKIEMRVFLKSVLMVERGRRRS